MNNKDNINKERWFNLLRSKEYSVVREYWESRLNLLKKENLELSRNLTQDNLTKIGSNVARMEEIVSYLNKETFRRNELINSTKEKK